MRAHCNMDKHYQADAQAVNRNGSRAVVWEAGPRDRCVEDGLPSQQHSRSRHRDASPNIVMRRVANSPGCDPVDQQVLTSHAINFVQGGRKQGVLQRSVNLKNFQQSLQVSTHAVGAVAGTCQLQCRIMIWCPVLASQDQGSNNTFLCPESSLV